MTLHDQWLLMGAVVGLYLYDAALLLFHNEIVLEAKANGYAVSGGMALELRGRHLYLPSFWFPHRMLIRTGWPDAGPADARATRWRRVKLALSAIAPWTWVLFGLFFVGLPGVLRFGTDIALLSWLLLTYLTIVAMLAHVYRHRKALNLSPRAALALAADALLCAPFAINLVRKISLCQTPASDLRAVAASMLSPAENAALERILRERIGASLHFVEPGSAASDALHAYLKHFGEGSQ